MPSNAGPGSFSTMKAETPSSDRAARATIDGALAVGDPRLGAVDHVLLAVTGGAAADLSGVAPGIGLGEGERAAAAHRRHVGSQRCFCSSLPWVISKVAAMVWVLTMPVRLIHPYASSSITAM